LLVGQGGEEGVVGGGYFLLIRPGKTSPINTTKFREAVI
jgi:hypothetical protein